MGAEASLTPAAVPVNPGGGAEVELAVTNTGGVVDSFTFEVLGDPAAWAVVEPAVLSLFPGQSETATVRFAPPAEPGLTPGPRPYAVRVISNEDPQHPHIAEGALAIAGIPVLAADLSPRTGRARGRRAGKYQVAVDNRGNAAAVVDLAGFDAQDLVDVTVDPPRVEVGPGSAVFVTARARARTRVWRGQNVLHRFTVAARPADPQAGANAPEPLDASLLQEPAIPGWLGKVAALVLVAALILAGLWFTVLKPVVKDAATGAANQALTAAGITPGSGSAGGGAAGGGAAPSPSNPAGSGGGSGSSPSASPSTPTAPAGPAQAAPVAFAQELNTFNGPSSLTAGTHQLYSVTDLVLQNPNGDTGALTISRGGKTLITTRMENFRDYDLHFVTAINVTAGQSLTVSVTCDKPGNGATKCTPAVLVSGTSRATA
jgi:hypothetical protein